MLRPELLAELAAGGVFVWVILKPKAMEDVQERMEREQVLKPVRGRMPVKHGGAVWKKLLRVRAAGRRLEQGEK